MDGEIVLAKGFGQARPDASASEHTVYHIGSLTKQFTAAAVLRLIETGARAPVSAQPLTLDTPMREIFEGVDKWAAPDEPPITVRSLLTMTSNLPNFTLRPPAERRSMGRRGDAAAARRAEGAAAARLAEHVRVQQHRLLPAGERHRRRVRRRGRDSATSADYVRAAIVSSAGPIANRLRRRLRRRARTWPQPHYRRRPAFAQPHWLDGCGDMASNVIDLFAWNKALMEGRAILGDQQRAR